MVENLIINHTKCIKYTRYYFVVSAVLFLLFGNAAGNIRERLFLVFSVGLGYLLFFNFTGFYLRKMKKINKYNWEKARKKANFHLNFYLIFGVLNLSAILMGLFSNPMGVIAVLFVINVPIGLITGTLRSKFYLDRVEK